MWYKDKHPVLPLMGIKEPKQPPSPSTVTRTVSLQLTIVCHVCQVNHGSCLAKMTPGLVVHLKGVTAAKEEEVGDQPVVGDVVEIFESLANAESLLHEQLRRGQVDKFGSEILALAIKHVGQDQARLKGDESAERGEHAVDVPVGFHA